MISPYHTALQHGAAVVYNLLIQQLYHYYCSKIHKQSSTSSRLTFVLLLSKLLFSTCSSCNMFLHLEPAWMCAVVCWIAPA